MPNAQDNNLALISDIIDDEMGIVGMHANRRRDVLAQARGMGIIRKKRENRAQPFVIGIGLQQAKLLEPVEKDGYQIIGCCAR